ncbi:glutathione S-transferase family protein [Parendozoicomonas haliclonae]|uniref:Uncharacterized protein n=1 Tax=Parendozoicomonas haliclonae TaxID=1960125 RepID=A0A1X7AKR4_9GAMM|nr:glutathione S-transferase family protein [Parendozoicomonas haliclonae]SMA48292.1 hypothetical protein EHSB41UT_02683 [Parendozoicomonas haliclonae]
MDKPLSLYGWQVSPYTAKVRAYLDFKNIPYREIVPSAFTLNGKIKKDAGQIIMPVVYQDEQPLQDSSVIIDALESQNPNPKAFSDSPSLHIIELILEMFADEWLPMAALHYRWNYPGNRPFIMREFGKSALPWWPSFIQTFVAKQFGNKMSGYLPILGIKPNMEKALEQNTHETLSALNQLLSSQPFIMGSSPCLADFSLYGPLYAHLYRDPDPDDLFTPYQHVVNWIHTLQKQGQSYSGDTLPPQTVLENIQPLMAIWRDTHLPLLQQSLSAVREWHQQNPEQTKLPRVLGKATLKIGSEEATRLNLTYGYWMWQRVHQAYHQLNDATRQQVQSELAYLNIGAMLEEPLPPVKLERCRLYKAI